MQLEDAEVGSLCQNVEPDLGRQLACHALQLERVGAVRALQRAAMRELGEQPQRRPCAVADGGGGARLDLCAHTEMTPLSDSSCSSDVMSDRMRSRGALYVAASSVAMSSTRRAPSQRVSTATAIGSGVNTRSGARITQRPRAASWRILTWRASAGREEASMTILCGRLASLMSAPGEMRRAGSGPGSRRRGAERRAGPTARCT